MPTLTFSWGKYIIANHASILFCILMSIIIFPWSIDDTILKVEAAFTIISFILMIAVITIAILMEKNENYRENYVLRIVYNALLFTNIITSVIAASVSHSYYHAWVVASCTLSIQVLLSCFLIYPCFDETSNDN